MKVKGVEYVAGMALPVAGQAGELGLGLLLQVPRQGHELSVELGLLLPGEELPGGGVGEGLEAHLLVL